MNKIYFNLRNIHSSYNKGGLVLVLTLIAAIIILCYLLFHNPHQILHKQIFTTADNIRNYYRENPGYWKLSTETAKSDNLLPKELLKNKDYGIQIGQGENGEAGIPGDMTFNIVLHNVGKSACISLVELPINQKQQLGLLKITVKNNKTTEFSWGADFALPIKKYAARDVCITANNTIIWTFQ